MSMQEFRGPVKQVAGNDIHNHHYPTSSEPPDNPEVAVWCPQCNELTWRYSQYCRNCALDLFAWRTREAMKKARARKHKIAAFLGALAICSWATSQLMPSMAIVGMLFALIAGASAIRFLE